jgi:hypothetical protein
MRLFSLLNVCLPLALSLTLVWTGLAAPTDKSRCTVISQSPSDITLDLSTCISRSEPVMQEAGVTPAKKSSPQGVTIVSYRTSNRDWTAVPS